MLTEVQREAYNTRYKNIEKTNSSSNVADDDEEDADVTSSISSDAWSAWYPQEWIGWVMYGVSSEHPTEHWVNQPFSDGPIQGISYLVTY